MDGEKKAEEEMCHDLDRSYFSSQFNQSGHFSGKGQNEIQPEYEKSKVKTEESSMIRDILALGRSAVRSSSAASSAAQEASKAAATAAKNAKAALEEIEQLVNMLEGHKHHHCRSVSSGVPATKISSDDPPQFGDSAKTSVEQSKDEKARDASSKVLNCDQKTNESGEKDKGSVQEKVRQIFSRKETILDGIKNLSLQAGQFLQDPES